MDRDQTTNGRGGVAWAEFFLVNHEPLAAYAVSLCGNLADAQDLIQDVLVRMVEHDRPVRNAKPFVFRCLRNLAIDRHRAAMARPTTASIDDESVLLTAAFIDTQAGGPEQRETAARIRALLEDLPADRREVIVLKIYAGLTFRDISKALDRPLGTVTSLYTRGLAALRATCEKELGHVIE